MFYTPLPAFAKSRRPTTLHEQSLHKIEDGRVWKIYKHEHSFLLNKIDSKTIYNLKQYFSNLDSVLPKRHDTMT